MKEPIRHNVIVIKIYPRNPIGILSLNDNDDNDCIFKMMKSLGNLFMCKNVYRQIFFWFI